MPKSHDDRLEVLSDLEAEVDTMQLMFKHDRPGPGYLNYLTAKIQLETCRQITEIAIQLRLNAIREEEGKVTDF